MSRNLKMPILNRCEFAGNLTRDAETKTTDAGKTVAKFSIARIESFTKDSTTGALPVSFLTCKAWGDTGTRCGDFRKGDPVIVSGRLITEHWTGKDGAAKSAAVLYITEATCIGWPAEATGGEAWGATLGPVPGKAVAATPHDGFPDGLDDDGPF